MRTNFRVERRVARTTQDWCKPLHGLDGPIRRIVGATLAVALALGLVATCLTLVHAAWIFTAPHAPGAGPRRNLLYVGTNRRREKEPLVKYWYHVNGTAPASCAHHWKEPVDGSSVPDKSRPVPTTAR
jgi:hypothetical protein